jgi:hypothetical protein
MKTLDRQKLDIANKTQSNIFGRRGRFTPEFVFNPGFNPIEFEGIRNQPN